MASRARDHILIDQQRNADKQARPFASRKAGRWRKVQPEGLPYVIERRLAKKKLVTGPFVVESISGGQVNLRTTRRVPDQEVRYFSNHIERVARCATITDMSEKLQREKLQLQRI